MYCPTCGRDNSIGRRYCASCGTNLEAVSQALSGRDDDFFTKIDTALDTFLGRYAEHVFKNAPSHAAEQRVARSWQVLGQSIVTSLVDLLLFSLMWNVIPLRFLMLLISTPVRLLSGKAKHRGVLSEHRRVPHLPDSPPEQWLLQPMDSVTEQTTVILAESERPKQNSALRTRPPE